MAYTLSLLVLMINRTRAIRQYVSTTTKYKKIDGKILIPEDETIKNLIRNEIKYEGYISRQFEEIEKIEKYKNIEIPKNLDIAFISGLSNELKQKIQRIRPSTIGQASRISGITPAALNILLIHIKKNDIQENLS